MNKIIRVSNLSRLFGIEQESWGKRKSYRCFAKPTIV